MMPVAAELQSDEVLPAAVRSLHSLAAALALAPLALPVHVQAPAMTTAAGRMGKVLNKGNRCKLFVNMFTLFLIKMVPPRPTGAALRPRGARVSAPLLQWRHRRRAQLNTCAVPRHAHAAAGVANCQRWCRPPPAARHELLQASATTLVTSAAVAVAPSATASPCKARTQTARCHV